MELAASLGPQVQAHLELCPGCRQVCAQSLQLEVRLRRLHEELPGPDLRSAVMKRVRQGERAAYPTLTPAAPNSGAREVVLLTIALTLATAWLSPLWLPGLAVLGDFFALFGGWGAWLVWPDLSPWTPIWDTPLLVGTLALCATYTRNWWHAHG